MAPEAFFDCLKIADALDESMEGASRMDIQRISFLSCLLSIYQSKPVSDWGYRFANTGSGTPFSDQLHEALVRLLSMGRLVDTESRLRISNSGREMLRTLSRLDMSASRAPCLDAACASMLAVPRATLADGIDHEPTIAASHIRSSATLLLEEPYVQTLHEHFATLSKVLPPDSVDLFSPSVLWLSYMSQTKLSERAASPQDEVHA